MCKGCDALVHEMFPTIMDTNSSYLDKLTDGQHKVIMIIYADEEDGTRRYQTLGSSETSVEKIKEVLKFSHDKVGTPGIGITGYVQDGEIIPVNETGEVH